MVSPALIRIGIDVGGTFTHAVSIDGQTAELTGKVKVPTTHRAAQGVAKGIIDALMLLLEQASITPDSVAFIAHSTTQATNALLEGDVAAVGILGMGGGAGASLARLATNAGKIKLAPGKFLKTNHRFIDTTKPPSDDDFKKALNALLESGAEAIAISEAFSVDAPDRELRALAIAHSMGLYATAGCQVSQLYGLKARTRTAVINASMLPKMIESADMTERCVREAGIKAPVMIMRSDGGVMDIDSMRQRPILTLLSGPAAGVAAAMMYLHISDGIFLEVGGTSTDISAIRNGKALVKSAEVGGHKIYLRTLDVRTVGIAGGSMLRMDKQTLIDVGPRSAHIAGMGYMAFSPPLSHPLCRAVQPRPGDPSDYAAFSEEGASLSLCLTPTCAANFLGLVPQNNCAKCVEGNDEAVAAGFALLAGSPGKKAEKLAKDVLHIATGKCWVPVRQLIADYKLDEDIVTLVGGGGGAAALVPALAQDHKMKHSLAENADVISAIGVALALLRETVERQVPNPDSQTILRLRQEAQSAVQRMGADPGTIEVQVEVDARTNIVRATACGATSLTGSRPGRQALSSEQRVQLVAESMRVEPSAVKLACQTEHFQVWEAETRSLGLLKTRCRSLRTVDGTGIIRLQTKNGDVRISTTGSAEQAITGLVEDHAAYGDAGRIIPGIILFAGPKMIDLSGLLDLPQMLALAKIELADLPAATATIVLANII